MTAAIWTLLDDTASAGLTFADVLGYLFGAGALAASLGVVLRRDAVVAAMNLVLAFFCLSGVYLLLGFPFLAAIQILVYAGAIMVLFLFVIMLLGVSTLPRTAVDLRSGTGTALTLALFAEGIVVAADLSREKGTAPDAASETLLGVSELLFNGTYVLVFEAAGVLLLAAMVGVVVVARRDLRKRTAADVAREHAFDPRPIVGAMPPAALPDGLEATAPRKAASPPRPRSEEVLT